MAPLLIPVSREEENTPSSNPRFFFAVHSLSNPHWVDCPSQCAGKCPCIIVAQCLPCASCTWINPSTDSGIKAMAAQKRASRISVLFQSKMQAGYFTGLSVVD